jgi:hypothetical protein
MDDIVIARGLHVLGVVIWIGGLAMVTTVLLPAIRRGDLGDPVRPRPDHDLRRSRGKPGVVRILSGRATSNSRSSGRWRGTRAPA